MTVEFEGAGRDPFIEVSKDDLDELRRRLDGARRPAEWPTTEWNTGISNSDLERLTDYWAGSFDWRAQESMLNALPHEVADIGGAPVRFLRFPSQRRDATAIILTHGWPSSILELVPLARRLSRPTDFGGDANDSLTVIVPALPGFPGSPQRPTALGAQATHRLWHRLMTDHLGFDRYLAHGGDLGAGVSARLGEAYPESVRGIHVLAAAGPGTVPDTELSDEEREYLAAAREWETEEGGYEHEQQSRPVTLAHALSDSPRGLLAWIVEKHRAWSDCGGDVSTRFSDDYLLTQASLYWFTNSIGTSFRPYAEFFRGVTAPVRRVEVPTAIAVFPKDLTRPPRSWVERSYNVVQYTAMPRGGHFAAYEEPELLAADIARFVRALS